MTLQEAIRLATKDNIALIRRKTWATDTFLEVWKHNVRVNINGYNTTNNIGYSDILADDWVALFPVEKSDIMEIGGVKYRVVELPF